MCTEGEDGVPEKTCWRTLKIDKVDETSSPTWIGRKTGRRCRDTHYVLNQLSLDVRTRR